jgi:2-methylcitrate dehydratase PrpD
MSKMLRRDFGKASIVMLGSSVLGSIGTGAAAENADSFPDIKGVTQYVGRFVVETGFESIPKDVIELGKKSVLDGLGLALAGSRAETGVLCRKYLQTLGISGAKSVVIGSSLKTTPRFAAFANGVSIHADDFDDTQLSSQKDRVYGLLMHPTVPVLPAIFAITESKPTSGREFLAAYHVGTEVECRIAEAISPRHYQDGFHTTGTCGPFGAAAACANLWRFDLTKTLNALGLAASHSSGLRENFGTMTKPFQAGHAAEGGLAAAEFAGMGWEAAQQILEAPRGFFHAAGGTYDPTLILDRLGRPYTFSSPGVSIKPYPSGSLSHPAMTEMMRLIEKHNINPSQVTAVEVGANHNMTAALLHHQPENGLQAKFSMEFCVAILLIERKAGLAQFSDKVVQRRDVQEMIGKVRYYVDPEAENAGFDKMVSLLKIHLQDGTVITGRADFGKGSPSDPMSFDEEADKFRGCADYAQWSNAKAEKIIAYVRNLESASNIADLAPLLSDDKPDALAAQ